MSYATLVARLASNPRPVLIDVWAPWCAPCRRMAPMIERLAADYEGRVDVWKVNADEQPGDLQGLKVIAIPTLVIFGGGEELGRKVGAGSEAEVRTLFEAGLALRAPERRSLAAAERIVRLAVGGALLALGLLSGPSLIVMAAGGVVSFTAIADRCPVWQAIRPRLAALFRQGDTASSGA